MEITTEQRSWRGRKDIKGERKKVSKEERKKEGRKTKDPRKKAKKAKKERKKERALRNINSSRVKRKRIGKTFSGKRKSIRQAVKLGGSSKWIRLRECVR